MKANLKNLEILFSKMESSGFDTSKPLLWGFYFLSRSKTTLIMLFEELKDKDYILHKLEYNDDKRWQLFVTKVDVLDAELLYRRNIAFNKLAEYFEVELYDGWDVEKLKF